MQATIAIEGEPKNRFVAAHDKPIERRLVLDTQLVNVRRKPDQTSLYALESDRMILLGHEITLPFGWAKMLLPRAWGAIRRRAQKVQDLEQRVVALETALARCPGEGC